MKKVIIALDYEPSAEKVATAGYEMAKALQAEVVLLHVVAEPAYYSSTAYSPIMGFSGFTEPEMIEVDKGVHKEAKRFLEESRKHLGDESIEISVLDGEFTEAALTLIHTYGADLFVMGTHSRRGIDRLLIGNLSEKIIRHTPVPVLVIPTHTEEEKK